MKTTWMRAEISIWDNDGTLVETYLVENFERLSHEVYRDREAVECFGGPALVHSPVAESVVFRFELPNGMTTRRHGETP